MSPQSTPAAPLLVALLLGASCAAPPPPPELGRSTLWGTLSVQPHQGVWERAQEPEYGSRRIREAPRVDYRRPGFAVVFLEGSAAPSEATLTIASGLQPVSAALGKDGVLRIVNRDATSHTVSSPGLHLLKSLRPAESVELKMSNPGEVSIFVPDLAQAEAKVLVAPGPFCVVSAEGRWELRNLPPGPATLHVWHPRFPPLRRDLTLETDSVRRIDLEIGVDAGGSQP